MAKKIIQAQMQQRRDTKANWAAQNPVLLAGELGIVSDDPNLYKVGDGTTAWNALPFRGFNGTVVNETGTSETAVMSQKAVTEKLTELSEETNGIAATLEGVSQFEEGKSLYDSGDGVLKIINDDRFRISSIIPTSEGDVFYYEGKRGASGTVKAVIFLDSAKNYLPSFSISMQGLSADGNTQITTPSGAAFVQFTANSGGSESIYRESRFDKTLAKVPTIEANVATLQEKVAEHKESLFNLESHILSADELAQGGADTSKGFSYNTKRIFTLPFFEIPSSRMVSFIHLGKTPNNYRLVLYAENYDYVANLDTPSSKIDLSAYPDAKYYRTTFFFNEDITPEEASGNIIIEKTAISSRIKNDLREKDLVLFANDSDGERVDRVTLDSNGLPLENFTDSWLIKYNVEGCSHIRLRINGYSHQGKPLKVLSFFSDESMTSDSLIATFGGDWCPFVGEVDIPNGAKLAVVSYHISELKIFSVLPNPLSEVYKYGVTAQITRNENAITLLQHDGLLPELDAEADRVNYEALTYDCDFRFLVFTDPHSLDEQKYRKYRNIMEKGVIDMTLGLGDYNPYKQLERTELKKEINKMLTIAGKGENNVYAVGNHEFMASFDWINTRYDFADNQPKISNDYVFTKREMFEMTTRHLANRAVFNENDPYGCYYYLDYEPQKIRVIVLNSSDIYESDGTLQHLYVEMMTMQQEQISWYANKALDFTEKDNPSEWSVMVCLHHYYMSNAIHNILAAAKNGVSIDRSWTSNRRRIYDEATKKYLTDTIQGEEGAITITINKDFSQQGAINVIGIIHGHSHNDVTRELSGGIKALEFMTDNFYLNHMITAPLNGLAKGTYFFVTNRGQKMQFTLDEDLPNARAIAYNHYFDNPPSGHEEVYIYDENGQIIKFWDNMLAMDSVTGTEITGFVDTQTERVDDEKCSIVCIDKETKTIKCFPYGSSTYREVQY